MKMEDRELLELAAKASEIHPELPHEWNGRGLWFSGGGVGVLWNPLTNDGDALRLAVKLGEKYPCAVVGIFNRATFPHASASIVYRDGTESHVEQDIDGDVAAATRRAIVRAAAEIGKTKD